MGFKISGIGSYLPKNIVHNNDLAKKMDTSDEWIYSHTGIHSRHVADKDENCSDMATKAALQAMESAGCTADELDMILVSTVTSDYQGFPSVACLVQNNIGAKRAGVMDLGAACSGFVYGIEMGRSLIATGDYKKVLVIGSEVLSRISNDQDRSTYVLFGDGAGAVLLEESDKNSKDTYFGYLRGKGKSSEALIRETGGTKNPYAVGDVVESDNFLAMDGKKVYFFAVSAISKVIERLLEKSGLTLDDIDYVVPHQANIRIIEAVCNRKKYPLEKFHMTIDKHANTSSASIPLALHDLSNKKNLKSGDKILMVGFGAGLTYGGVLIEW